MAEKYYGCTPFGYCAENPVKYIDPLGEDIRLDYDSENQSIIITCNIFIYGPEATDKLASEFEQSIMSTWGQFTSVKSENASYSLVWNISVSVLSDDQGIDFSEGINNYMLVSSSAPTSCVRNKHEGTIRPIVNGSNDFIHEFGHILGLMDRYSKTIINGKPQYKPDLDYEGNVMAEEAGMGIIEPTNILEALDPMMKSGMPSTFFINKSNSQRR